MDTKIWLASVQAFPDTLAKIDRTLQDGMPEAIFAFWHLIRSAVSADLALYERVTEQKILARADAIEPRLRNPNWGFDPAGLTTSQAAIEALGGHLRALDRLHAQLMFGSVSNEPDKDYRVSVNGAVGLVVPIERTLWRTTRKPAQDKRDFAQRGVVHHRILPAVVDGAAVTLVRAKWLGTRHPGPLAFGSTLFPKLEFLTDEDDETFLVTAIDCAALEPTIHDAVARAHQDECMAAVFPELTIDEASLTLIDNLLIDKPWLDEADPALPLQRTPAFIVAGSWHRESSEGFVNVAPIRDGDGGELSHHIKRKPYKDHDGRYERIAEGKTLNVLVFDNCLVAFGICLDFCDEKYVLGYDTLDIDLVIVPSCGDAKTMTSHLANARLLWMRRKCRTFVVQQAYPPIKRANGFLLPPNNDSASTVAQLRQSGTWKVVST